MFIRKHIKMPINKYATERDEHKGREREKGRESIVKTMTC